ncbi:MAG: hypothetical protein JW829_18055, partial [Pirellulales bacterium]|nr:hypothetical protein [Pirellulales bacterium]
IGFTLGCDSDAPLGLWIELVCNNEGNALVFLHIFRPGGTTDSSPPVHWWVRFLAYNRVPEGRLNRSLVDTGTVPIFACRENGTVPFCGPSRSSGTRE